MQKLDIIITHHNEPWAEVRKMFEMIRMQRGVKPGEFRVILVQDGEDSGLDMQRISRVYPFVQTVVELPGCGVSEARNTGLDFAEAAWVMFCDCDDCLYSVDSLHRILESLREAGDRADLVWSDIWIELRTEDGRFLKNKKGWNTVFIHGKVYRREFLVSHGITFDTDLDYSEDAMFNALVSMEIQSDRIAKMPEVVYMWCFRRGSLSNYEGGDAKRNLSLYKKRVRLIEAYAERGMKYDARTAAARCLLDYYWEINSNDELPGRTKDEWIHCLQEDVIKRWPDCFTEISGRDRQQLLKVTIKEAEAKRLIRDGMISPEKWLREIGAVQ